MRIDIFFHDSGAVLESLHQKVDAIMATQEVHAASLRGLALQLAKVRTEITDAVARLTAAIAAAGATTQEVDDALSAVQVATNSLDDLNPDEAPV